MEAMVKKRMEENENSKWKIRELVEPVVSTVEWAKDFVGDALEKSPTTSLAWAGVCLFLPAC
jgi:hypothetical protein